MSYIVKYIMDYYKGTIVYKILKSKGDNFNLYNQ